MIELESLKIGDLAFDFKNGKSMAVDYYRKLDVDRLLFSLKHQLFKSRSIVARTRQRYRATEKGKIVCRRKSRKYFYAHRDDPAWRAHRIEIQKVWKARRKAAKILATVPFENKITLQDIGTITVYIYKGVA